MNSFKGTVLTALLFVLPTAALFELDNQGYIVDRVIFATVFMISVTGLLAVIYSDMEKDIEPLTPIRNEDAKKICQLY